MDILFLIDPKSVKGTDAGFLSRWRAVSVTCERERGQDHGAAPPPFFFCPTNSSKPPKYYIYSRQRKPAEKICSTKSMFIELVWKFILDLGNMFRSMTYPELRRSLALCGIIHVEGFSHNHCMSRLWCHGAEYMYSRHGDGLRFKQTSCEWSQLVNITWMCIIFIIYSISYEAKLTLQWDCLSVVTKI